MNIKDIVKRACQEPTLVKALAYAALIESERVVKQAHEFLSGRTKAGPNGQGWDTCFENIFVQVEEAWNRKSH